MYYHSNEDYIQKIDLVNFLSFFLSSTQMLITDHYFALPMWDFHNVKELSFFKDIKKIILTLILN